PEVEVYGAEFEVSLAPVEGLTLSLAATALEHEITQSSDESIDILGHFRNLEGDAVPYTADLTVRFNAEYRWSTGNIEPFIGLTYLYEDEKSTSIGGEDITISQAPTNKLIPGWNHPFLLDEINLLNVRAGFTSMDGKWTAFVWGRNVTDEYYWSNSTVNDDTIVRLAAKPRTYGLTVNYQF
ncbi:TonB-dependent receptor, partial [Porticoccaceae bacterium]|nr:TonB-dependent receptor [Porticoccaceae bacterium]